MKSDRARVLATVGTAGMLVTAGCAPDPSQHALAVALRAAATRSQSEWAGAHVTAAQLPTVAAVVAGMRSGRYAGVIVDSVRSLPQAALASATGRLLDSRDGGWLFFDFGALWSAGETPATAQAERFAQLAGAGAYVYDARFGQFYRAVYFIDPIIGLVHNDRIGVANRNAVAMIAAAVKAGAADQSLQPAIPAGLPVVEGLDSGHARDRVTAYAYPLLIGTSSSTSTYFGGGPYPRPSPNGGGSIGGGGYSSSRRAVYVPEYMRGSPVADVQSGYTRVFGRGARGGFGGRGGSGG